MGDAQAERLLTDMTTTIYVNASIINSNTAMGEHQPPIVVVRDDGTVARGHAVEVMGPCKFVYRPDAPLPSGARVWAETESDVIVEGASA